MVTLKDIFELLGFVHLTAQCGGWTEEFDREFHERERKLGTALATDFRISPNEILKLERSTPLGSLSEVEYYELTLWLAEKGVINFESTTVV